MENEMKNRFLNLLKTGLFIALFLGIPWIASSQTLTDGFDYPIGNRGYDGLGRPIPINEGIYPERNTLFSDYDFSKSANRSSSSSGWHNSSDVGNFVKRTWYSSCSCYSPSESGLHPAEDWNYESGSSDVGKSVYAVANGEVLRIINNDYSDGHMIILKHYMPDGHIYYSLYQHITALFLNGQTNTKGECLNNIPFGLGTTVQRGQEIGRIASGPNHLHFEMRDGSKVTLYPDGGSKNSQGNVRTGIYPLGRSNGYYTTSRYVDWNNLESTYNISIEDLSTAINNMKSDGIIDPSDFIEDHRPTIELLNDATEIYGGAAKTPKSDVRIWFQLPNNIQLQKVNEVIIGGKDVTSFVKGMDSFKLNQRGYYEVLLNFSALKNQGFINKTYDIELKVNDNIHVLGKNKFYFSDPDEFLDNTDKNNWYYKYVLEAVSYGIVKGSIQATENTKPQFKPEEFLKRGPAAKVLVMAALNLNIKQDVPDEGRFIDLSGERFSKIDETNGYFPYIQTLRNWKNAKGESCISTTNPDFNTEEYISIEEFAKILCNVFYLSDIDNNINKLKAGNIIGGKTVIYSYENNSLKPYLELLRNIIIFQNPEIPDIIPDIYPNFNFKQPERLINSFIEPTEGNTSSNTINKYAGDPMKRSWMTKAIINTIQYRESNPPHLTTKSASLSQVNQQLLSDDLSNYTIIGDKFELASITSGTAPDETLSGSVTMKSGETRTFEFKTDTWEGQPLFFYWTLDNGDMVPSQTNNRGVKVTAPNVTETTDLHLYSYRGTPAGKVGIVNITIHVEPTGPEAIKRILPWFKADVTDGAAPLTVQFSNNTLIPQGTQQISYRWSFGDGTESTEGVPSHTYQKEGNYTVSLTAITNSETRTSTRTNYISVISYDQSTSVQKIEYYFDTDPGVGNGKILGTGNSSFTVAISNIDISDLSAGMHTVFFRAQDSKGQWGNPQSKPIMVMDESPNDQLEELKSAEYYIDNTATPILSHRVSQQTDVQYSRRIDLEQVNEGMHQLMVRVKDFNGKYSGFLSRPLYIRSDDSYLGEIASFEYAIDTISRTNIYNVSQPTLQVSGYPGIDLENVSSGLHTILMRAKDTNNAYGQFVSKPFYLYNSQQQDSITAIQYAFDQTDNFLPIKSVSPDTLVTITEKLNLAQLTQGIHTLFIKTLNDLGKQSSVQSKPFYSYSDGNGLYIIDRIEYSIDAVAENGNGIEVPIILSRDVSSTSKINLAQLTEGLHTIHFKAKDVKNQWSNSKNAVFEVINFVNQSPIANAGMDQSVNEGFLVSLDGSGSSDLDNDALTYLWTAPEGITVNSITAAKPTFTAPEVSVDTDYTFSLVVNDGIADSPSDHVVITINNNTSVQQTLSLNTGWNIISANLTPANPDLKTIFQTLIDAGTLKKVMDETGKTIENFGSFGGWKNTIGNLNSGKGYKVNVTAPSTLSLEGMPVPLPMDISLNTGWNIISYPTSTLQDAKEMVQVLIDAGKLKKVMDETGRTIENFGSFGGWKNSIGNFTPGKGYKVSVTESCILNIPATMLKTAVIVPEVLASTHFTRVFSGNGTDHMNIYLVNLQSSGLLPGDEIGVFDGQYCVGSVQIGMEQLADGSVNIPASGDDGLSQTVNGFRHGNPVTLQLFREGQTYSLNMEKVGGNELFEMNASLFAKVSTSNLTVLKMTDEATLFKCYPNPFTREITIEVQNFKQDELKVEIYNMAGQRINRLFKGNNQQRLLLKWNGANDSGQQVAPGVYLCKVNGQSKQVIFEGAKIK